MSEGKIENKRKQIGKKTRFEVFKRDSFKCQYCGRSAPDVILQVDHIDPVFDGGNNEIINLITSCRDCNIGKGKRKLSDNSSVTKKKNQLDDLQEKRNQIEMMLEWQKSLISVDNDLINAVNELFAEVVPGFKFSDDFKKTTISRIVKKYGLSEILECTKISAQQYLRFDREGNIDEDSVSKIVNYIEKIARSRKKIAEKPYMADIYKINRSLEYKNGYHVSWKAIKMLEVAHIEKGVSIAKLELIVAQSKNWSEWRSRMEEIING